MDHLALWWYAEKDQKIGPLEREALLELIQTEKINPKTVMWKEGMEGWLPLSDIPELQDLRAAVPSPLPIKPQQDIRTLPMASAWPRFFARLFDVWWESVVVALVIVFILGRFSVWFVKWINGPSSDLIFSLLCVPIALILDALIYRFAGNTPGKSLFGLIVTTLDGKKLPFKSYLKRNYAMWMRGMACSVPLANLIAMSTQSSEIKKNKPATYDVVSGHRVRVKETGIGQKIIASLAFLSLFILMAYLRSVSHEAEREALKISTAKPYQWENPITHRAISVSPTWKNTAKDNEDGQPIYQFVDHTDHAVLIFALEEFEGITLNEYVDALQRALKESMIFADEGLYSAENGHPTWVAKGTMSADTDSRFDIQIIKYGNRFWRVVTIQTVPYAYSDSLVEELRKNLWQTAM